MSGKLQGFVGRGAQVVTGGVTSVTIVEVVYPLATVTVYDAGTANLTPIYSDELVTAKANPFSADPAGWWSFYAAAGRYDVTFSGAPLPAPFTLSDLEISGVGFVSAAAATLLDDATVADMRTTLGLGTLAIQNGTFSGTSSGSNTGDQTLVSLGAAPTARILTAGVGLSGGGDLTIDRTIDLENTAVTPGVYTNINGTVDAQGRLTAAASGTSASTFVASGVSHASGLVPDPPAIAGTVKYLREDATWVVPPDTGGGTGVVTITQPATGATLTLADNSTLETQGAFPAIMVFTAPSSFFMPIGGFIQGFGTAPSPGTSGTIALGLIQSDRNSISITPTGNVEFTSTAADFSGQALSFLILTSGTTPWTVTFGSGFKSTAVLSTGSVTGKYFTVTFINNGGSWLEVSRTTAM